MSYYANARFTKSARRHTIRWKHLFHSIICKKNWECVGKSILFSQRITTRMMGFVFLMLSCLVFVVFHGIFGAWVLNENILLLIFAHFCFFSKYKQNILCFVFYCIREKILVHHVEWIATIHHYLWCMQVSLLSK